MVPYSITPKYSVAILGSTVATCHLFRSDGRVVKCHVRLLAQVWTGRSFVLLLTSSLFYTFFNRLSWIIKWPWTVKLMDTRVPNWFCLILQLDVTKFALWSGFSSHDVYGTQFTCAGILRDTLVMKQRRLQEKLHLTRKSTKTPAAEPCKVYHAK